MSYSSPRVHGIVLHAVEKSYGSLHALRGIDLEIEPGETVALLGPNGAGKSTTIDLLLGLSSPDVGTVSLFGRTPEQAVAEGKVGGMLQTGSPIDYLSARELLAMSASLYPHPLAIEDVLTTTGVAPFADQRVTKLSGGQAQRLRFALALVADPDLLVLDEPTAALDVEGRRDFWSVMRAVAHGGKTVLFATHYLEEADTYADRIVLMANGQIIADGPATEIKARASGRTIRATLAMVDVSLLQSLPGVALADRHGDSVLLTCSDSDSALRALLYAYPQANDIEVVGAGLEEAFLTLVGANNEKAAK